MIPTPDSRPRRVLMLVNTDVYDDPRVINEGLSLVRAGYQVSVIGAARHLSASLPTRADHHGLHITLVPMVTTHSPLRLLRAVWQLLQGHLGGTTEKPETPYTNLISLLFFNLWCLRLGFRQPADVIHSHDFSPLPAAWLLTRLRRLRLIYDSHESAPDFYGGRKGRLIGWLERRLLPAAAAVITVGERLAQALRQRGAPQVVVIGNWKPLADYEVAPAQATAERQRLGLTDQSLVVSYLGGLQPDRMITVLLAAVAKTPNVTLLIAGRGPLQSEVMAAAQNVPNIHWLGWLDMQQIPVYTLLSDVVYYCLNTDMNLGNNYYSTPNKLFEALAAGKAVIARQGIGEISDILETTGAGLLLDEVTPETLQAAFQQLQHPAALHALQTAALKAREQYNWSAAEARLLDLYHRII